jgi:uncharacterized membrane-anchored protein YitT (DUF2179 family)
VKSLIIAVCFGRGWPRWKSWSLFVLVLVTPIISFLKKKTARAQSFIIIKKEGEVQANITNSKLGNKPEYKSKIKQPRTEQADNSCSRQQPDMPLGKAN